MSIVPICDPKKALMISLYKDPKSETFGNIAGSMRKAGYSKGYAEKTVKSDLLWLKDINNTVHLIQNAEKNLEKVINKDINIENEDKFTKGKVEMMKMQIDASKFVLKTLARSKYNEEKEQQNAQVNINIVKYGEDTKITEVEIEGQSIEG